MSNECPRCKFQSIRARELDDRIQHRCAAGHIWYVVPETTKLTNSAQALLWDIADGVAHEGSYEASVPEMRIALPGATLTERAEKWAEMHGFVAEFQNEGASSPRRTVYAFAIAPFAQ